MFSIRILYLLGPLAITAHNSDVAIRNGMRNEKFIDIKISLAIRKRNKSPKLALLDRENGVVSQNLLMRSDF